MSCQWWIVNLRLIIIKHFDWLSVQPPALSNRELILVTFQLYSTQLGEVQIYNQK